MSRTASFSDRVPHDVYLTPYPLAISCVRLLEPGQTAWEPHAGNGSFADALQAAGFRTFASDIREDALALQGKIMEDGKILPHPAPIKDTAVGDFLTIEPPFIPDVIAGNPPYSDADAHLEHALSYFERGTKQVGFLLRQGFLAGQDRTDTLWAPKDRPSKRPSKIYMLARRPAFVSVCSKRNKEITCHDKTKMPVGWSGTCPTCGSPYVAGTDATDYVFLLWNKGWTDATEFHWLRW